MGRQGDEPGNLSVSERNELTESRIDDELHRSDRRNGQLLVFDAILYASLVNLNQKTIYNFYDHETQIHNTLLLAGDCRLESPECGHQR